MNKARVPIFGQLWHFLLHLRWHYQVFILSGGYLMGGFFQQTMDWTTFGTQFLNVHLLLFGGATAYNSWWDKDEGAIGGLKHPPPMQRWMWIVSLLVQFAGFYFATMVSVPFAVVYAVSMLFFWLYSTPLARWKGTPVRSLVAIGVSTGTNSFLMGYLAANPGGPISLVVVPASIGVALVILSLYPTSQIYQTAEDRVRGDQTFAVVFGREAVFTFFRYAFGSGVLLLSVALGTASPWIGITFLLLGMVTGGAINRLLNTLSLHADDYEKVMRIKYGTSLAFVLFLCAGIILKHHLHVLLF
ncbi:UbiA family prenyltransferase [Halalkalibaculum sp. DA384]|uniref:UbiA family prenyltransferase n=1 Tax=Halalkalibaculum sp. DA384 TaxID=3373606 RepID=UPI003753EE12